MKNRKKRKAVPYSLVKNMLYLYTLQWNYRKSSLIIPLLGIPISISLSYLQVYLPTNVVENVIAKKDIYYTISSIVIIGIGILLLKLLEQFVITINFAEFSKFRNVLINMKNSKCLNTDYENIESPRFRILMQRADEALWGTDVGSSVEQMSRGSIEIVTNILSYILFGTILTVTNPILIIILTIMPFINYFAIKWLHSYQYNTKDHTIPLDKKMWYIAGCANKRKAAKDIRIYNMSSWLLNMYKNLVKERLRWDFKIYIKQLLLHLLEGMLIVFRDGIAYFILIMMVLNNEIGLEDFVLCFAAIGTFASNVGAIIEKFSTLNIINLLVCDFRQFLDYPEKRNVGNEMLAYEKNKDDKAKIRMEKISFSYFEADKPTIANISCTISAGEKIAIVGLNGAGKTTLIKTIVGLYLPTTGRILINNIDSKNYELATYYSLFSVVFQDYQFMPISILEIIACTKPENADEKKVMEVLKQVGLLEKVLQFPCGVNTLMNSQINEGGIELSGGEQQKLLLARALYKDAPIIILDEPAAALDPIAENEIYVKSNTLFADKTVIFISHRLASTRFCDRILFMSNGQIVEEGTHEELMDLGGEYAELYKLQSQYYRL